VYRPGTTGSLTPDKWADHRAEFCQLVGKPADPAHALAAAEDELAEALGELEEVLAAGDGPVRLDDGGDLVISPLTAEDIPAEATALKAELTEVLPFAPIVSMRTELDKRTRLRGLLHPRRPQADTQPGIEAQEAAAHPDLRHRHTVLFGWPAVPDAREVAHRQGFEPVLRERRTLDVHAGDGPAHHLRHERRRRDQARGPIRPG
jgi:hypothetical protein